MRFPDDSSFIKINSNSRKNVISTIYIHSFLFFSIDDCDGTGDHENYFKDVTDAYEFDGTKYTDCTKKAVSYRSKNEHLPLSRLIENNFLLLNRATGRYSYLKQQQLLDNKEILHPKFSWVVINIYPFVRAFGRSARIRRQIISQNFCFRNFDYSKLLVYNRISYFRKISITRALVVRPL